MEGEELQSYLSIMKQHHIVKNKKGKGSYSRKQKYKLKDVEQ
jgi:stalled ribosome alternative rescue factor ArfA